MTDPGRLPTPFYPVSLDVTGRACLVVGGGPVAARKARTLLECGATVSVIAPSLSDEMEALVEPTRAGRAPRLRQRRRRSASVSSSPRPGRPDVDGAVHDDAEAAGVWVNSADDRAHSSFILPAVHRDGPVTLAVSTSGLSPALASWLRSRLAAECGEGVGAVAAIVRRGARTTSPRRAAQRRGRLGGAARRPPHRARAGRPVGQGARPGGGGHDGVGLAARAGRS